MSAPTAQDFLRGANRTQCGSYRGDGAAARGVDRAVAAGRPAVGINRRPHREAVRHQRSDGDGCFERDSLGASAPDAGQSASPAGAGGGGAVTAQTPMTMVGDSLSVGVADDVAG